MSPDFGWRGVLDRFRQLQPTVLICTGGYRYNGKAYDRSAELKQIIDDLDCLSHVIYLPFQDVPAPAADAKNWPELLAHEPVTRAEFTYHHGPFGMPLWILFSSGTTGLPKVITHSHGGILLEQLKLQRLNMNLSPGDVLFFYTTTGWMMWNFMVSSLVLGVQPLLYDGNPAYPEPDALWRMAVQAKVTLFGGSPAYADMLAKKGVVPKDTHDLSALECVMLAGSPVSPEVYAWFYRNVKRDLWLHVGSGGTDVCAGFTGGTFVLGRSDATLNRFGVRIGTAEIYTVLESIPEVDDAIVVNLDLPGGHFFMPMFVKLADGLTLDERITREINTRLRQEYTPRHVPDKIIQVPAMPTTITGKKLEVPVRRLLMGVPLDSAANTSAMADPAALDAFIDYAHTQQDFTM